ncbi:helix-turn-helix domain-containing protein [Kitasatospora sp. NPDC101235]|uniref:helix-turn-helix domain-containing protein n=1 Tax=Kitasatospora sp. NPDC101235 TaxID=3364101 RepID=UPI0038146920
MNAALKNTAGNARLRAALVASGMTIEGLAHEVGMDPRTVERWLNEPGRTPYARHAHQVAQLLHVDPYEIWPTLGNRRKTSAQPRDEMLAWYPTRGTVPAALWATLLRGAVDRIDLALSCGLFLADAVPDLVELLTERAAAGTRVRLALPDPTQAATQNEATRLLLVEDLYTALQHVPGVRMVRHGGIANDVVRADEQLLVMPRVDGCPPAAAPVLHLKRLDHAPLTGAYLLGLDHVFTTAVPLVNTRRLAAA